MGIALDLRSLRRHWSLEAGHLPFVLKVDFGDEPPSLGDLVEGSSGVRSRLARAGRNSCDAEGWVCTKAGWAGVLVGAFTLDDGLEWLELFVAAWDRAFDGEVIGGPASRLPRGRDPEPQLTVFAAYSTDDLSAVPSDHRAATWSVDETTTRHLAEQAVHWAYTRGCRQHLRRADWWVEPIGLDHGPALAQGCHRYGSAEVRCAHDEPFRSRHASFEPNGRATYQVTDPTAPWADRLDALRAVLSWTPPRTDLGMLRHGLGGSSVWGRPTVPWPHVSDTALTYNQPLLASFVPDVSGIQLLTDAHLARATDLSGWHVRSLGGGRHLVEHPNLETWYAAAAPPDDVLARARADFGGLILTPELIDRHMPWAIGDPWRRSWVARAQRE